MRHAVLVMMHPIHSVFGNRRPRLECVPEHIRSFGKNLIRLFPSTFTLSISPGQSERSLKFFYFSCKRTLRQTNEGKGIVLVNKRRDREAKMRQICFLKT